MRLIDKDALLKELGVSDEECKKCNRGDRNGYCTMSSDWTYACDAICTAPTIEERKTGKWIRNDNGTYSCSLCQSWTPEEQYYYARFCLFCGADMRGEENGRNDTDT